MYAARKALRRKEKSCGERERERERQTDRERGAHAIPYSALYWQEYIMIGESV